MNQLHALNAARRTLAFGRLIERQGKKVGVLPAGFGENQVVVDEPAWIAVAKMLVRKL